MEIRSVDNIFGMTAPKTQNHESIATLYSCVRLITNSVSATTLKHLNEEDEEIQSPLSQMLKEPQKNTTYFSWMNSMLRDFLMYGNAYAIVLDKELIYVPQNQVQVYKTQSTDEPYFYRFTRGSDTVELFPDNVIHFKNISADGIIGLSPMLVHRLTFDASVSMADYTAKFVENSATLGGVLSYPKKLTAEQITSLSTQFSQRYSGTANAGKIPILTEDMQFTPLKPISPADMDFINNYKLNKSLIAEIFQVPLSMLGTSDLSYNNAESNALMFMNFTLLPILTAIEQELTLKLIPKRSKNKLKFLVDSLKLASTKEKADSLSLLVNTQIFTPNEARKKYGLTAIEGGDKLKEDANKVGDAQQQPKNTEQTNTENNTPKPPSKRKSNDETDKR